MNIWLHMVDGTALRVTEQAYTDVKHERANPPGNRFVNAQAYIESRGVLAEVDINVDFIAWVEPG